MPSWPSVSSQTPALAAQYNALSAAIASWLGPVSAAGNLLTDLPSAGLRTTNASWQEFQVAAVAGANQAADTFQIQYNTRTNPAGSDSWSSVLSVAAQTGALNVAVGVTFGSGALFLGAANFNSTASFQGLASFGAASFAGSATFNGPCYSNANSPEYFTTANASWQEFQLSTYKGAAAANDLLQLQYNTRSSSGGTDSWTNVLSIAAQTGALTITPATTFQSGVNLASFAVSGAAAFSNPASISFGSNFQTWTPTVTGSGSMTASSTTFQSAQYCRIGPILVFSLQFSTTLGGTMSSTLNVTLPVSTVGPYVWLYAGYIPGASGPWQNAVAFANNAATNTISISISGGANFTAGTVNVILAGWVRVA